MASQEKVKTSDVEQETVTVEQEVAKVVKKECIIEVKRKTFGKSEEGGKPLYGYSADISLLKGMLNVSLVPKDSGAFQFLDLIYSEMDECSARVKVSSFTPENSKEPIETIEVEVFVQDSDGDEITSTLYPQRKSDKEILVNFLKKQKRA